MLATPDRAAAGTLMRPGRTVGGYCVASVVRMAAVHAKKAPDDRGRAVQCASCVYQRAAGAPAFRLVAPPVDARVA